MANNFIIFGILLVSSRAKAIEFLAPGLPFVANYGSSFNAHTINHDIRTPLLPIQAAPLIQPAAQVLNAFPNFARLTATSVAIAPQTVRPINPVVRQDQPINPAFQPNDERNESIEVEAAQRSLQPEGRSKPARLEAEQQGRNDDVPPNPALLGAQFLARKNSKATPTPVPNGFVFQSRAVSDEGRIVDNTQSQFQEFRRAKAERVRIARIQRLPAQERSGDDSREQEGDMPKENNPNLVRRAGRKEEQGSPKAPPRIYSQLITF